MYIFLEILIFILRVYSYILFLRVILSWFRITPRYGVWSRIYKFLVDITEPVLVLLRRMIPMVKIGGSHLDLSYITAILVVQLIIVLLRYVIIWYI
ncbi:MAG: YggT family protein [Actinomycetia bacterium]|nr:YggT family protein [Actinomycetes bacterium]